MKVLYDQECVCLHTGGLCSYSQGIPCANGCQVWSPGPTITVCSRLAQTSASELVGVSVPRQSGSA